MPSIKINRNAFKQFKPLLNSIFYYDTVRQMYHLHGVASEKKRAISSIIFTYFHCFYFYCFFVAFRLILCGCLLKLRDSSDYLSYDMFLLLLTEKFKIQDENIFIFAAPILFCGFTFHYFVFYKPPSPLMWANFYDLIIRNTEQIEENNDVLSENVTTILLLRKPSYAQIKFDVNAKLQFFPAITNQTRIKLHQMVQVFQKMQIASYVFVFGTIIFFILLSGVPEAVYSSGPLFAILSLLDMWLVFLTMVNIMKTCTFSLFNLLITCRFTLLELAFLTNSVRALSSCPYSYFYQTKHLSQFRVEHTRIVRFLQQTKMPTALFAVFFLTNFFFNVYIFTFLYYSRTLPFLTYFSLIVILVVQTVGSFGSTIPIVMVNVALCHAYPYLYKLQINFKNSHFIVAKWKLGSYAELIDGSSQYLAPKIEAFQQLTKESVWKFSLFYFAYLIFFSSKFVGSSEEAEMGNEDFNL